MATSENQDEILALIINAKNRQANRKYIWVLASKFILSYILYAYRLSLQSVAKVS